MNELDDLVVYGIDAGANVGWCRVDSFPGKVEHFLPRKDARLNGVGNNKPAIIDLHNVPKYIAGLREDEPELLDSIFLDLSYGKRVVIGLESPTWFPISSTGQGIRFPEEVQSLPPGGNYQWWNPTASSATVNGINIAIHIFRLVRLTLTDKEIKTTNDYRLWSNSTAYRIFIYESFVSGKFKVTCNRWLCKTDLHKRDEGHIWDAFVSACSFWGLYTKRNLGKYGVSQLYPTSNLMAGEVVSHVHTVLRSIKIPHYPLSDFASTVLALQ
ncbi:hypothetical protein LLE49_08030 [Alicyclobacillus tolerans]|uniref:hypothetical protein n=1 Tax=Alicyclobacillus tolerans TaxID=90970 RepID=UPI001F3D61F8|nr:hypothetical protein [Alicyclobacillus tolerans]MCF8564694.1 hypothetical protein [Alicyclobacillus tolerans]